MILVFVFQNLQMSQGVCHNYHMIVWTSKNLLLLLGFSLFKIQTQSFAKFVISFMKDKYNPVYDISCIFCIIVIIVTFTRFSNILFHHLKFICRPDVSELETKLSEQSKILSNLQQKVTDLASKVYPCSLAIYFCLSCPLFTRLL